MVKKSPNQKLFFGYARMRQRTKLNGSGIPDYPSKKIQSDRSNLTEKFYKLKMPALASIL
jgi:hypothetical protein